MLNGSPPEIRSSHQLRSGIVTFTAPINDLVDTGITWMFRIAEDGVTLIDAVRTHAATDAIFGVGHIWRRIRGEPANRAVRQVDAGHLSADRPCRTRWLLNYRPAALGRRLRSTGFAAMVKALTILTSEWLRGDDKAIVERQLRNSQMQGACLKAWPTVSPDRLTVLPPIIDIALFIIDAAEVAGHLFRSDGPAGHRWPADRGIPAPPRRDRRHSLARLAIRDDIYGALRSLCFDATWGTRREQQKDRRVEHLSASRVARHVGLDRHP